MCVFLMIPQSIGVFLIFSNIVVAEKNSEIEME